MPIKEGEVLNMAHAGLCGWLPVITFVRMLACLSVCQPPRQLIASGITWTLYD